MNYKDYDDNELLSYVKEQNEDAESLIYQKYQPKIEAMAKRMYRSCKNTGLELNDFIQEGMLALNEAMKTYQEHKNTLFYTYATTCIERKMISLVISTKRLKHRILNESIPLEYTSEDENKVLEFLLEDKSSNPEDLLIGMETEKELRYEIENALTEFESQVLALKLSGFTYREIADILDKDAKAVDNALQRIKQKAKEVIKTME